MMPANRHTTHYRSQASPFLAGKDTATLRALIERRLRNTANAGSGAPAPGAGASAVLFLLGRGYPTAAGPDAPCLILNKRSRHVRQPGDLCCPGGGIDPRLDPPISRLMALPGTPLRRWAGCQAGRGRNLALLLTTALREGLEEMRVNPLGLDFLGPLPAENLVLFRRRIFPMVCWVRRQRRFWPNWEVERVVYVPLPFLLDPGRYARYRLQIPSGANGNRVATPAEFPCYLHTGRRGDEILWGATYRITVQFLQLVFGFTPPEPQSLPVIGGALGGAYLRGRTERHAP